MSESADGRRAGAGRDGSKSKVRSGSEWCRGRSDASPAPGSVGSGVAFPSNARNGGEGAGASLELALLPTLRRLHCKRNY
jgi:hypothetical protein